MIQRQYLILFFTAELDIPPYIPVSAHGETESRIDAEECYQMHVQLLAQIRPQASEVQAAVVLPRSVLSILTEGMLHCCAAQIDILLYDYN